MHPVLIAVIVFVGVTALVGGMLLFLREGPSNRVEDRLDLLTGSASPSATRETPGQGSLLATMEGAPGILDTFFERFGNVGLLFEQADVSLTLGQLLAVSVGLGAAASGLAVYFQIPPLFVPLAALGMGILPLLWLLMRRKRRLRKIGAQLPDALEMLGRALRAGQSLGAGFSLVNTEVPAPLGKEFGRVFEEQNLGVPLEESLASMADRIPNLDIKFFATAVILQRQTGGDLAEILDKIGSLVRERFKIWGQIQALTGEGRLSGVVLLALPVLLFFAVYRLNPDYASVLFTDPAGKKLLAVAVILQLLGAVVIRKIVNIKV